MVSGSPWGVKVVQRMCVLARQVIGYNKKQKRNQVKEKEREMEEWMRELVNVLRSRSKQ